MKMRLLSNTHPSVNSNAVVYSWLCICERRFRAALPKGSKGDLISCNFINHVTLRRIPDLRTGGRLRLTWLSSRSGNRGHDSGSGRKPLTSAASAACGRRTNAANLLLINLPAIC